mmetsp:Transcript_22240/g.31869  ORF Transcript_22240/g.31869 Transcript_22240/m.31869 type:complete len:208 (+) Transcript_22240:365-988(+)
MVSSLSLEISDEMSASNRLCSFIFLASISDFRHLSNSFSLESFKVEISSVRFVLALDTLLKSDVSRSYLFCNIWMFFSQEDATFSCCSSLKEVDLLLSVSCCKILSNSACFSPREISRDCRNSRSIISSVSRLDNCTSTRLRKRCSVLAATLDRDTSSSAFSMRNFSSSLSLPHSPFSAEFRAEASAACEASTSRSDRTSCFFSTTT